MLGRRRRSLNEMIFISGFVWLGSLQVPIMYYTTSTNLPPLYLSVGFLGYRTTKIFAQHLRPEKGKLSMARTKGSNKSQTIREFLTANPESTAKEVVESLGKTGVKVKEGLVYAVKGSMKEKKRRKKRVAKAAMAASKKSSSNGQVSRTDAVTMIREVKALAEKAGGYEKLRELVDALAE
jgi:hypothetical protein